MDDETLEDKLDQLHDDVRAKNKEDRSIYMWLWRGILFGIGSTVGVALIFYIFLLVAHQLVNVPILGKALQQLEPLLKQTAETRVPNVEKYLPAITVDDEAPSKEVTEDKPSNSPQETETTTQTVSDEMGFFTLSIPDDWITNQQLDELPSEILSVLGLTSPEWKASSGQADAKEGMFISINVLRDEYPDLGISTTEVDGEPAISEHTENNDINNQLSTDTIRWNHKGHGYIYTATYNPSTYDGPGMMIEKMLLSFKFTN